MEALSHDAGTDKHTRIPNRNRKMKGKAPPKQQGQQKQKRKARRQKNMRVANGTERMSACAAKYAIATLTPFSNGARGACVPRSPNYPSQKVSVRTVTSFNILPQYRGAIFITPNLVNDMPIAYATNIISSTFYSGDPGIFSAANTLNPGWNRVYQSTAPYTATQIGWGYNRERSLIDGRIVSVGVRITCTTPLLQRGGTVVSLVSPRHANISGYSYATMSSQTYARMAAVGNQPFELVVSAVSDAETEFTEALEGTDVTYGLYPFSGGATGFAATFDSAPTGSQFTDTINSYVVGAPIAAFMIDPAGQSQSYNVEIISHMEYAGPGCQGLVTPNEGDMVNFNKIQQAKELAGEKLAGDPSLSFRQAGAAAIDAVYSVVKQVPLKTVLDSIQVGVDAYGSYRSAPQTPWLRLVN